MNSSKPLILYIFRKPSFFYSIENIFKLLSKKIGSTYPVATETVFLPREGFSVSTLRKNGRFIKRQIADLYHITGDVHYISFFLPPRKTILTIHDCVFMFRHSGIKKWVLKKLLLDWPVARCRSITTISEKTKMDILQFTGCAEQKITVIPNPVSINVSYIPKSFNSDRPIILFIGTTPNKNLSRVIDALAGISCELHIVGELPEEMREKLESHNISFLPFLNLDEQSMAAKYIESDLVLFPSTFEGFGMPIIEAQQAGRAVITSNLIPMNTVAGAGACLVDPLQVQSIRAGILKIMHDRDYREALVEKGFANVKWYDADKIAEQYYRLYQEILTES
jgi:glycosyltransferase involved in cell wall biosynthesis